MATHVYANDLEIACKSTDGTATPAFPDPCWSPPSPSAGPIVIPYPNTAFAPDITNGTTTVFIQSKTVAIEDKAYFSRSTGNEPATQAFAKGVQTGIITGKAYFRNWSLDVVFEGLGVDRHTDMVSHNHASMPSNTPLFPYVSRGWFSHPCEKEEKKIERACAKPSEQSDSARAMRKQNPLLRALRGKRRGAHRSDSKGWHWKDDHCDGLEIPLGSMDQAKQYMDDMGEVFNSLPSQQQVLAAVKSELTDMAENAALKAGGKVVAKAGLKQLAGSSLPVVGNIAMGIWTAVDVAMAVGDVSEIKRVATESLEQIKLLEGKFGEMQDLAKKFEDFTSLPEGEDKIKKAQEIATEAQDMLATLNDCTRARKCNLVPYNKDGAGNPVGAGRRSKVESSTSGGCCGGQTGHHLINGAMVEGQCKNYEHNMAPTVCVEGTSQDFGSHKRVHDAMDGIVSGMANTGQLKNGGMSVDQAINAAALSHKAAFPASGCSTKCIKAQLESYYGQMCKGATLKAVDKHGSEVSPEIGGR